MRELHVPRAEAWDDVPLCEAFAWKAWATERNEWLSQERSSDGYVRQQIEAQFALWKKSNGQ